MSTLPKQQYPSSTILSVLFSAALLAGSLTACTGKPDAPKLLAEAQQYQRRGDIKAAIIQLKNILQANPDDGAARALLGDYYLEGGDLQSAEKEYRRARQARLPDTEILPRLARVMLLQQQYKEVLATLPDDGKVPDLMALRAAALLGLDKRADAAQLLEAALALQGGNSFALLGKARLALMKADPAGAMAYADQALALHPADIDHLRFKADLLRAQGKPTEARTYYDQILALRPADLQTRIDIAGLLIQAGGFAEAKQQLAKARTISQGGLALDFTQALLDFREQKYPAALERLQLVQRGAPDYMPGVLLSGAVQYELNNNVQAELHLRRFLESQPGHLYASKLLAATLLRNGKPSEALALLAPLLERLPDDPELLATAGDAHMRLQQFNQAADYLQRAVELAPGAPALHTALGASRLGMGDGQRAIAELERASGLDSKSSRAGTMLVVVHLRARDYPKALAAVHTLEKQGNNPAVQNLKGGVLLASQDFAGARVAFQGALSLDPAYQPALDNLAQLDVLEQQPERARQRYEAVLAKDKRNIAVMTALARLATGQGRIAEAIAWLERAQRENPDALAPAMLLAKYYLRAGDTPKALILAQKIQAGNPGNTEALALLALAQTTAGNHEAALDSYSSLAALQPDSPMVQMQIAGANMGLRKLPAALTAARKALALQPENGLAQLTTVRLLVEQGSWNEAFAIAQAAQKRNPQLPLGYRLEADILMAQSRTAPALKQYEYAYKLEPSGPAMIAVHRALTTLGRKPEATERFLQWLKLNPRDGAARIYLASALLAAQDYAGAAAQYEKIVEADAGNVMALNDLAWTLQSMKDQRALEFAERAHKLAGDNPAIKDTLGWVLTEQGQAGRALPLLKQASEAVPQAADIRFHYATALMKTGDKPAARRQFELLLADKSFTRQAEVRALLPQL
ncbi:PEP-CTERM system TPR-repeat protein PrsT [Pseudoduganella sp. LjRoot289]|uniref:XrtA/PEP-CTERM system TPR-repeat protein PrsT n=1 Tax=Pseudoduganella sp. LjRoot289 TaxID=3342314 RepID=UPI003ECCC5CF